MPMDIGAECGERWVCGRKQRGKIFWRSFRRLESTNAFFSYKSRCPTVSLTQKHDVSANLQATIGSTGSLSAVNRGKNAIQFRWHEHKLNGR